METCTKKYRLGNQSQEFALITNYLGWHPKGFEDWNQWYWDKQKKRITDKNWRPGDPEPVKKLVLVGPTGEEATLLVDHQIIKDAFPMSVYSEKRFDVWHQFCIVANPNDPLTQFIIPMH